MATGYPERFKEYFSRPVAEQAASSLSNGAEIELQITDIPVTFTFTREGGKNALLFRESQSPQLKFFMNSTAAESILSFESQELGEIGIHILKLVTQKNSDSKPTHTQPTLRLEIHAGFLTLFSKGYFGVLKSGGNAFASFLASKGLGGMGAIKAALSKAVKR